MAGWLSKDVFHGFDFLLKIMRRREYWRGFLFRSLAVLFISPHILNNIVPAKRLDS